MVEYSLLPAAEWDKLTAIFKAEGYGERVPAMPLAAAAVGKEDGKIVEFLVLQLAPHFEPIWRAKHRQGKPGWKRLVGLLEGVLPKGCIYYAFSTDKVVESLTRRNKMKLRDWKVWEKEV